MCERAKEIRDGMLIIQGGGINLIECGVENTVKELMASLKAVEGKNIHAAVVGVIRRPREGIEYERIRQKVNKRICEEVVKMKLQCLTYKNGNLSYIDPDSTVGEGRFFSRDGVHLNAFGKKKLGGRLYEWVKARSVYFATEE